MAAERCYLDVGGYLYVSTRDTLRKSPYLETLLPTTPSETPPFVDRDGVAFSYILNFLRNGSVHVNPDDRSFVEFLMGEAQFFGLRKMEAQLGKLLEKRKETADVAAELRNICRLLEKR